MEKDSYQEFNLQIKIMKPTQAFLSDVLLPAQLLYTEKPNTKFKQNRDVIARFIPIVSDKV